ncbi:MAG TPA: cadmium resistance transporter [Burkholderiaceae bacterium]|nr:cadmium resistance transporter [Burkholderiaceae bacterium]
MSALVFDLGIGIAAFISTDIDDLFLLAAFFADTRLHRASIVIGQYLGIGALVLVSAMAALLALAIPEGWIALLGFAPLLMGLANLRALRVRAADTQGDGDARRVQQQEHTAERRLGWPVLAVASVTVANGGDNVGLYPAVCDGIRCHRHVRTHVRCDDWRLVRNRILAGEQQRSR